MPDGRHCMDRQIKIYRFQISDNLFYPIIKRFLIFKIPRLTLQKVGYMLYCKGCIRGMSARQGEPDADAVCGSPPCRLCNEI